MGAGIESLLRLAHVPPPSVPPSASVEEAVAAMVARDVGAVAVVEHGRIVGLFTERDLMKRVVHEGRAPAGSRVRDVMVRDPLCLRPWTDRDEALRAMVARNVFHAPITDDRGFALGILPLRQLLKSGLEHAVHEIDSLESYLTADGPGG